MKQVLLNTLDYLSNSPLIIYPAILLCTFSACKTIYYYSPKAVGYYTKRPWNIIIPFLGYIIYQLMHIISSIEIQTLFHMPPTQLPHTLIFLTLLLCIPVWLFVVSIWIKIIYLYFSYRDKKFNFFLNIGLSTLSIIFMALSYKFAIKLSRSQELIRQMATYVDYVDKSFMPSSFAHQDECEGFLIIDEQTISVYRKNNDVTQFRIIKSIA